MDGDDAAQGCALGVDPVDPGHEVGAAGADREPHHSWHELDGAVALDQSLQVAELVEAVADVDFIAAAKGLRHEHRRRPDDVSEVALVSRRRTSHGVDRRLVELSEVDEREGTLDHRPPRLRVHRQVDGVGERDRLPQSTELPEDPDLLCHAHRPHDEEPTCLDDSLELLPRLPLGDGTAPVVQGSSPPLPRSDVDRACLVEGQVAEIVLELVEPCLIPEPYACAAADDVREGVTAATER